MTQDGHTTTLEVPCSDPAVIAELVKIAKLAKDIEDCAYPEASAGVGSSGKPSSQQPPGNRAALGLLSDLTTALRDVRNGRLHSCPQCGNRHRITGFSRRLERIIGRQHDAVTVVESVGGVEVDVPDDGKAAERAEERKERRIESGRERTKKARAANMQGALQRAADNAGLRT